VPNRPAGALTGPRLLAGFALLGLLVYGAVLVRYASYSAGASDSSGYLNQAHALASGQIARPIRGFVALGEEGVSLSLVLPLGFVQGRRPATMAPSYPTGYPLHMAAFAAIAGWDLGPYLVSPVFAVLGILAFYRLARELGLAPLESASGAAILAFHPAYVFMALQSWSDVVATTWATVTVMLALLSRRASSWALGAGAAFAVACLTRPSNALLLLPIAAALPRSLGVLSRFALGALPGFVFLFAFNLAAYGHPLRTGYGDVGHEFSLAFIPARWRHYTHWLGATFTPLLPLAWLAVAGTREARGRDRLMLLVWFGSFFVFFCSYRHYDSWWYLRFLMPAFPALILGALLAARPLWRSLELRLHLPRRSLTSVNLLPALALAIVVSREISVGRRQEILGIGESENAYLWSCRLAVQRLPPGAIVLSKLLSGALEAYTHLTPLRFDSMDRPTARRLLRRSLKRDRPWYALLHELEKEEFEGRGLGSWTVVGSVMNIELLELAPESLGLSRAEVPGRAEE
jgi:hypothetical protein